MQAVPISIPVEFEHTKVNVNPGERKGETRAHRYASLLVCVLAARAELQKRAVHHWIIINIEGDIDICYTKLYDSALQRTSAMDIRLALMPCEQEYCAG